MAGGQFSQRKRPARGVAMALGWRRGLAARGAVRLLAIERSETVAGRRGRKVDSAFGRNLRRLAETKATYDPDCVAQEKR